VITDTASRRTPFWEAPTPLFNAPCLPPNGDPRTPDILVTPNIGVTYSFGAGLVFLSCALFQLPANIVLARVGAKRFVFSIMTLWAVFSTSAAFIQGPTEFYIQRFLLGAAACGFFPGMMYYLSLWFPAAYRARFAAMIMVGTPAAFVFGGPLSTLLLDMDGIAGTGAAFSDARIFALAPVLILGAIYGLLLWLPQIVQAIGFPPLPRLLPLLPGRARILACRGDQGYFQEATSRI
jgi:MFS family permease